MSDHPPSPGGQFYLAMCTRCGAEFRGPDCMARVADCLESHEEPDPCMTGECGGIFCGPCESCP